MKTFSRLSFIHGLVALVFLGLIAQVRAEDPAQGYTSGFSAVRKASNDLYKSLDEKNREHLHPQPISLETPDAPQVYPIENKDENPPLRMVAISAGCIDLLNRVAHAKAIDKIEPGYFDKYVLSLAKEGDDAALQELPNSANPKFWTEDVMNDQISNFNQMVGMMVALNLSHHYLKHYDKYAAKLTDAAGQPVSINNFLTEDEWDKSVRAAAVNSLNCAMATAGIQSFFEAIDKMPKRPKWTLYFLPAKVDVKRLKNQLAKYEVDFFHGKLK